MSDLLVITPSRGRPLSAARLLTAVHKTAGLFTHVHFGLDEDDPELPNYMEVLHDEGGPGDGYSTGPRRGLAAWTNDIAAEKAADYPFLASLGDDMVPRTKGWDRKLIRAIKSMGGTGFAYPFDGIRDDIPEAVVMSSDIPRALGWMALPECQHWYIDNAWADLGKWADCIRYLRAVAVDHLNPGVGKGQVDALNAQNATSEKMSADKAAWQQWRTGRMWDDVEVIRKLKESNTGLSAG